MKTLIVGMGEVGIALAEVLKQYNPICYDIKESRVDVWATPEIMHITFPYSDNFVQQVKEYQEKYEPKYTVVHSTVPVGTCSQITAIDSPIRGLHPNLESGIKTFVKFLGGPQASGVADYFRRAGLRVCLFDKAEITEAMKLFDTEYYRVCIEFALRVKTYCDANNLNFHEVYTLANQSYNEGYSALGHPEFVRPVLQPIIRPVGEKQIGGHCVLNNKELIKLSEKSIQE